LLTLARKISVDSGARRDIFDVSKLGLQRSEQICSYGIAGYVVRCGVFRDLAADFIYTTSKQLKFVGRPSANPAVGAVTLMNERS